MTVLSSADDAHGLPPDPSSGLNAVNSAMKVRFDFDIDDLIDVNRLLAHAK